MFMRKIIPLALAAALMTTAAPSEVMAKGCIRGMVAGGVAGHYAGHHAVLGAMGGCVAGRAYYKHKANKAAVMQQQHNGAMHR
jgi:hypothetical protein